MATLTISITVPDDQVTRVKDSFCSRFGWTPTIIAPDTQEEIPNPVTQNAFIKRRIILFIKNSIRTYEAAQAELAISSDVNGIDIS